MKIEQLIYANSSFDGASTLGNAADWVLVFGSRELMAEKAIFDQIRSMYPRAYIMGCSTAGEMHKTFVREGGLCVTAIHFEKATVSFHQATFDKEEDFSYIASHLLENLEKTDLRHIFVLADGLTVNGSSLIRGFNRSLPEGVTVSGGLAADSSKYKKTLIMANSYPREKAIVFAAIYGNIRISSVAATGWKSFGIERLVTRSQGRTLYELDGKPALDLYKAYLGEHAKNLPLSGVRFPLSFRPEHSDSYYIRSLQSVNEEEKSILFFGEIPQGSYCKLTRANPYNLLDGAKEAAEESLRQLGTEPEFVIAVSCRGRQFILRQMTEDELLTLRETLGCKPILTGFYSYGEFLCRNKRNSCEMHNQTMMVTLFAE